MNIGQILETHLGWASASLGRQVNKMIMQIQSKGQTKDLKDKLLEIYDIDDHQKIIKNMNDDEVLKVEKKFQHIEPTQKIIKKYGGMWFNDEIIVIEKS